MPEPMTMTRGQVQDLLSKFAAENPRYREALVNDPKAVIERQFATKLGGITVKAVLDTPDTVHVVIPYVAPQGELTDDDLEAVAGGKGDPNIHASCGVGGGSFNTVNQVAM